MSTPQRSLHGVDRTRRCWARCAARPFRPRRSPRRRPASPRRPCRRSPSTVRSIGSALEPPGLVETLAEPRDLGAVDDRAPRAVRGPLADVELDRVRADVDHRVAPRARSRASALSPRAKLTFGRRGEPELAHGRDHAVGVFGLDGDRPRRPAVGVAPRTAPPCSRRPCSGRAACARATAAQGAVRPHELVDELVERVLARVERRTGTPSAASTAPTSAAASGNAAFSDRHPLLEPVVVDVLEPLDVHQPVADLDGRVARPARAGRARRSPRSARARARRSGRRRRRSGRRTSATPSDRRPPAPGSRDALGGVARTVLFGR